MPILHFKIMQACYFIQTPQLPNMLFQNVFCIVFEISIVVKSIYTPLKRKKKTQKNKPNSQTNYAYYYVLKSWLQFCE